MLVACGAYVVNKNTGRTLTTNVQTRIATHSHTQCNVLSFATWAVTTHRVFWVRARAFYNSFVLNDDDIIIMIWHSTSLFNARTWKYASDYLT